MNNHTPTIHPTAQRLYDKIKKELGFPDPIPEQLGITPGAIHDAYTNCLMRGLTEKQSENIILKMWANAGK